MDEWEEDGDTEDSADHDESGSDTLPDPGEDPPLDPGMDSSPDPGWDTDLDTYTDPAPDSDATEPPPCTGAPVGGFCWYLSALSGACDVTCTSRGGYSEGTRTYAGSGGTSSNCDAVLDALGVPDPGTTTTIPGLGAGIGCAIFVGDRIRVADTPTTEGDSLPNYRRACACVY